MSETYTIGTVDLTNLAYSVTNLDPVVIPPPVQDDYVVPGRNGVIAAKAWFGPQTWSVGAVVVGTGATSADKRANAITSLQTLGAAVFNNGDSLTITRVNAAGTAIAAARYLGWDVQWQSHNVARVAIDFRLLDGGFRTGGTGAYVL